MRDVYHEELAEINDQLVEMTRLVESAMSRASRSLLDADLQLAEAVIAGDVHIDRLYVSMERRAFDLMARQQPVAVDLRFLVTSLRIVAELERMADLAVHIAKVARRRYPGSAVPGVLHSTILGMGQAAVRIAAKAATVLATTDTALAAELERDDDVMDALQRELFAHILGSVWTGSVEEAVDVTLCGRFYERFADHAVSVARRVAYLATGERPRGQIAARA